MRRERRKMGTAKQHSCPSKEQMSLFFLFPLMLLLPHPREGKEGGGREVGRRNVKRIRIIEHHCMVIPAPSSNLKSSIISCLVQYLKKQVKETIMDEKIKYVNAIVIFYTYWDKTSLSL